jgi:two-component system, OmpR family, sensor histidine kinase PhoQ
LAGTSRIGLRARLLLTSTLVLGLGLGLTGWVLDRSFTASVVAGAEEQLKLLTYSLLGAADEDGATLRFPSTPPEPRLDQPQSGLYATVSDASGALIWESPSLRYGRGASIQLARPPADRKMKPGTFLFRESGAQFEMFYRVIWETEGDQIFTFRVIADRAPFRLAIASFRRTLMLGLAAVVAALMGAQAFAVAWGLRPVAQMAARVEAIEAGRRERMEEDYPPELLGLARNIDRFIDHEINSRDRYRKAMDDLAHSLKTPLAVLRNALSSGRVDDLKLLGEQLDRMETTVSHQLSRAMAARPVVLAGRTAPGPIADRLIKALQTAYRGKGVVVEQRVKPDVFVRCDERDLMEMLGNLIENAFKYCKSKITVDAVPGAMVRFVIDDDGPGVPPEQRIEVLARGARGDTAQAGHGIGLAVVVELASSYRGGLAIEESPLGGARIVLDLPGGPAPGSA